MPNRFPLGPWQCLCAKPLPSALGVRQHLHWPHPWGQPPEEGSCLPCCFRLSEVNNTCPSSSEQGDHSPAPTKHLPFMAKIPRPPWPPSKTSEPCWSCPGMVPTLPTVAKLGTHPTIAFFGKPHLPINSLLSPRLSPTGSGHGQGGHQPAKENERHCPHPGNFTRESQGFRSREQLGLGTQGLT